MSMLPEGIIPIGDGGNGRVFDFVWKSGITLITDYYRLDKDVWAKNSVEVTLGEPKKRITLTSIGALKNILDELLSATMEILSRHTPVDPCSPYTRPDFSTLKRDLLVEQLIFDILFDKYVKESALMTRNGYSTYIAERLCVDGHAVNEKLTRGMAIQHDRLAYSNLSSQIAMLGVDPDKYAQYYIPRMRENLHSKKPKFVWDLLYYNFGIDLTYRQYRRQLTRDNRNYPYEEIVKDLKSYSEFISKLLPVEYESYEKYFRMSMDYYVLESYKRVDFMFKLTEALDADEIATINRNHFLVHRFVPDVLVPSIQDGNLVFGHRPKYYRPLFIVENMVPTEIHIKRELLNDAFPQEAQEVNSHCVKYYEAQLKKYQYVRAKTYELFKYHCTFSSDNYIEIKDFLRQCYDMRAYHQSNTFWSFIQHTEWKDMDEKAKNKVKKRIQHFLSLSDAFFWKSHDRDYKMPKNE